MAELIFRKFTLHKQIEKVILRCPVNIPRRAERGDLNAGKTIIFKHFLQHKICIAVKIVRNLVDVEQERHGSYNKSAGPQNSETLPQEHKRVGYVLQDIGHKNNVAASVLK